MQCGVCGLIAIMPVGAQMTPTTKAVDYLAEISVSGMGNFLLNCW